LSVYDIISGQPNPWLAGEVSETVIIDGHQVEAVPVQNAVTGDIELGIGFEADDPYLLCALSDVLSFGNLHGKMVTIGTQNYMVRNVNNKKNIDLCRLTLVER